MPTTIIKLDVSKVTSDIKKLIKMIVKQHDNVKIALRTADNNKAIKVMDNHSKIQAKYDEIQEDLEFLVTKAPVDKYLRRTLSALSIITELLRIAAYAKHIAKFVIKNPKMAQTSIKRIDKVHHAFRTMLLQVDKIITSESVDKAIALSEEDEIINELVNKIRKALITSIAGKKDEKAIKERLFVFNVINALERASDHIVNICESVIYTTTGNHRNL